METVAVAVKSAVFFAKPVTEDNTEGERRCRGGGLLLEGGGPLLAGGGPLLAGEGPRLADGGGCFVDCARRERGRGRSRGGVDGGGRSGVSSS